MRYKHVNIVFLCLLAVLLFWNWQDNISLWAIVAMVAGYIAIQTYGAVRVSSQFFVPIRCEGPAGSGAIAVTFDDGPLPGKTEEILGILKEHHAPTAFFCIGHRVEKNPELVRQIHAEGHIIGNHSYSHSGTFDLQSTQKIAGELSAADDAVHRILGLKPHFFRPPYGITNPSLARAVRRGGYVTIGWSVRSFDTIIKDKAKLFNRVTRNLKAGDIVLFHDYCDSTIAMLPDFLNHVAKVGLKVVRVDEMLGEKAYA